MKTWNLYLSAGRCDIDEFEVFLCFGLRVEQLHGFVSSLLNIFSLGTGKSPAAEQLHFSCETSISMTVLHGSSWGNIFKDMDWMFYI